MGEAEVWPRHGRGCSGTALQLENKLVNAVKLVQTPARLLLSVVAEEIVNCVNSVQHGCVGGCGSDEAGRKAFVEAHNPSLGPQLLCSDHHVRVLLLAVHHGVCHLRRLDDIDGVYCTPACIGMTRNSNCNASYTLPFIHAVVSHRDQIQPPHMICAACNM